MAQDIAALIEALLKSGRVSADTREDLEGFAEELEKGELDSMDRRYVEALAGRVLDGGEIAGGVDSGGDDDDEPEDDGEWDALEERAEAAEARVEELEGELEEMQRRIDALEGELATLKNPEGT